MSSLKTSLYAGLCLGMTTVCAHAYEVSTWTFAACAGRFSAELEHARLMGGGEDARHLGRREAFVELVDATAEPDAGRALLSHRIDAKHAQARLLQAGTFQQDKRRAQYAMRTAAAHLRQCDALLLEWRTPVERVVTN